MEETGGKRKSIISQIIDLIPEGHEGLKILFAALFGVAVVFLLVVIFHFSCRGITDQSLLCWSIYKTPPWIVLAPIATAPALLLLWHWRTKHRLIDIEKGKSDIENANRRLISERFNKAIDHLGSDNEVVNLGAIYELESISKESQADHWTVVETLAAYVRKSRPLPENDTKEEMGETPRLPTDIQAALTVLGRRKHRETETEDQHIDLSYTDLRGADLRSAHLERVNLYKANMQEASIEKANLQEANLNKVNLKEARLQVANLQQANFFFANLQRAWLPEANLQGAYLNGAQFQDAILTRANLQKAFLMRANFQGAHLFETDFKMAEYYPKGKEGETLFPKGFDPKKHEMNPVNIRILTLEPNPKTNKTEELDKPPEEIADED